MKVGAKKGNIPWNKGKKWVMPIPWNKGLIGYNKYFPRSKKWGIKISLGKKQSIRSTLASKAAAKKMHEVIKGRPSPLRGRKLSEKTKEKISLACSGENHNNWKGGLTLSPYPRQFNSELRLKIRKRDSFICCLCGRTEREELEEFNRVLCVNHIDFDKNNYKEENLNTLCLRCNVKINREREYWTNYFNTIL